MPEWLRKAGQWIRDHWLVLLGILAGIFALVFGVEVMRRSRVGSYKGQLEVERKRREVERLRGERDRLVAEADEAEPRIEQIDAALAKNKREIVAAHQSVEGMTADDIATAFDDLGY